MKPYLILSSLLIFLASCSLEKKYQKPEFELPKQFGTTAFADTSSIADIEWKQFFKDPVLQSLIEKGLGNNHDLLVAIKRIDIAQQQTTRANALSLPEVNAQITGQSYRPSDNSVNGLSTKSFLGKSHIENYNAAVTASWEIDVWGRIKARKGIALAQYLQTFEGARTIQTELVAAIAQGYFNLLMLDQQLLIARKNLALSDSFVVATTLLKDAGFTNQLAVQQAISRKLSTAQLIPLIEQQIALQENGLQQLTGQLPGRIERNRSLNDFQLPLQLNAGLPSAVVSRRPDVRSSELELMIANSQIGVAQANMYPALNITAGAGLESFKASNWFNIPNSLFGLAAGSIVQPIFKRKALRSEYEISKLQRDQAVITFKESVLNAMIEVSNAMVQIEKTKEQQKIAKEQVSVLSSAVNNAQVLFKSDMANYLEVIAAQSNALQAELNFATLQKDHWSAVIELYRSLGGGWK